MWKPTDHTTKLKDFIAHEMAKHGFLSLWYFVITLEAASSYFDENGNFKLLTTMKEMHYEEGKMENSIALNLKKILKKIGIRNSRDIWRQEGEG